MENPPGQPPPPAVDVPDAPAQAGPSHKYLDETAARFARDFRADRVAIFVLDPESGSLAMRAASGFPMFGQATVVLKLGEGLSGRALAERRPIYTESASMMRGYRRHPNFPDDDTQTFLAVPLLRGRERVGVIALWRRTGVPFLAEEISAARLECDRCTAAVENAGALMLAGSASAGGERQGGAGFRPALPESGPVEFKGQALSNGLAMGPVRVAGARELPDPDDAAAVAAIAPAVRSWDETVEKLEKRLGAVAQELDRVLPEAASMLLEADTMILRDENFGGRISAMAAAGTPLQLAILRVATETISLFESSKSGFLREKARDVEDLALRLLETASSEDPWKADEARESAIVVAARFLPSDVLRAARDRAAGVVLCSGAATAHVSLLLRSLHVPALAVDSTDPLRLPDGVEAIVDCAAGSFVVRPDEARRHRVANRRRDAAADRRAALGTSARCATLDGVDVALEANVNILADTEAALRAGAAGIGLYRTEFPFLMRSALPGEADQLAIYRRVLDKMPDRPVTFRTLDAGGDKALPYLERGKEENPALGLRGIRFSLRYPEIFDVQLRALLRAVQESGRDDVSVMFPMVSSVEEFRAARDRLEECRESLRAEYGDRFAHEPFVGTMVEVPAALGVIDALAEESDFFSIGTNDLIQYLLAADRTNATVSSCWLPHHPAVLHALESIAAAAARHGIPCSLCGEMGRDPRYLPFLIGIGLRTVSLESSQIPKNREIVARLSVPQCEEYARRLLSLQSVQEIEAAIDDFSRATFGG